MASTVKEINVPSRKLRQEAYNHWDTVRQAKTYSTCSFGKRVTCHIALRNVLSGHGEKRPEKSVSETARVPG